MRSIIGPALMFVLFAAPTWLEAQAFIGYGINVARAGAAGVGAGAGVGGILTGLKKTSNTAATAGNKVTVHSTKAPVFEEDDLEPKTVIKLSKGDSKKISTGASQRKIKGGVVISGVPASDAPASTGTAVRVRTENGLQASPGVEKRVRWDVGGGSGRSTSPIRRASRTPRDAAQPSAKPTANDPEADESADEEATAAAAPATAAGGSEAGADSAAPSSSPAPQPSGPRMVIAAPLKSSGEAAPAGEPVDDDTQAAEAIGIEVGEDVAAVIERFGKPSMVLKGISGRDYTEKYTFRTKDGRKIVVLALNGKVTAIAPDRTRLAARR